MMMVRKSKGLTDKHIKVLEFLTDYQNQNGRPPSIREIGEKVKISSTSVVNYYLDQLKKMGYVERDDRVSRGLRLTEKVNEIIQSTSELLRIPILGPIRGRLRKTTNSNLININWILEINLKNLFIKRLTPFTKAIQSLKWSRSTTWLRYSRSTTTKF